MAHLACQGRNNTGRDRLSERHNQLKPSSTSASPNSLSASAATTLCPTPGKVPSDWQAACPITRRRLGWPAAAGVGRSEVNSSHRRSGGRRESADWPQESRPAGRPLGSLRATPRGTPSCGNSGRQKGATPKAGISEQRGAAETTHPFLGPRGARTRARGGDLPKGSKHL